MAKVTQREVLTILRLFELADDTVVPREITYLKIIPMTRSTAASFVFKSVNFYLLFDDYLGDSETEVIENLNIAYPGVNLKLIKNPRDNNKSFGMPHKSKTVYLAENNITSQRLDMYLRSQHPDLSRSALQKYIKEKYVTVNDEITTTPKHQVKSTDKIFLNIPEKTDFSNENIPIIFEDDNVLVMNKPAGMLTHSKGVLNDEFTVADFLSRFYSKDGKLDNDRSGIVHRLDRDTSGIIIGAKNSEAAKHLRREFSNRNVKKTYLAVLTGIPKIKKAIIDLPIARNMNKPSTFKIEPGGKSAVTKYKVLKSNSNNSLVMFNPITGRTHQLRVHAEYLGCPILGDKVYGNRQLANRMYLHASELELTLPGGERKIFKTDTPKGFEV